MNTTSHLLRTTSHVYRYTMLSRTRVLIQRRAHHARKLDGQFKVLTLARARAHARTLCAANKALKVGGAS